MGSVSTYHINDSIRSRALGEEVQQWPSIRGMGTDGSNSNNEDVHWSIDSYFQRIVLSLKITAT